MTRPERPLALVATTPDDSHAWNLVGVQLRLEERGFRVVNLGPCTPASELAEQIRDRRPDLVVLSTVNGHGSLSLPSLMTVLDLYQVRRAAPIVVGGLLTTTNGLDPAQACALAELGFGGIFTGEGAWTGFDAYLAGRGLAESGFVESGSGQGRRSSGDPPTKKGPAFAEP